LGEVLLLLALALAVLLLEALLLNVLRASRVFGVVVRVLLAVLRNTAGDGAEGRSISVPLSPLRLDLDTEGLSEEEVLAAVIAVGARDALILAVKRLLLLVDCCTDLFGATFLLSKAAFVRLSALTLEILSSKPFSSFAFSPWHFFNTFIILANRSSLSIPSLDPSSPSSNSWRLDNRTSLGEFLMFNILSI
jgi:hypothetical protein